MKPQHSYLQMQTTGEARSVIKPYEGNKNWLGARRALHEPGTVQTETKMMAKMCEIASNDIREVQVNQ